MSKGKLVQKSLRNEIRGYDKFLNGAAVISGLVSPVEQREREAEAKLLFFTHMPDSIIDEFGDKLYEEQKHNEELARIHLPVLPAVSRESTRVLSTGTASSSDYIEITQTYRRSAVIKSPPEGMVYFQGSAELAKVEIENLAVDEISKKKLTDLLEKASKIHNEISKSDFGKNPLTKDLDKLSELYELWQLVVSDLADYVYLNIRIRGSRVILKKADSA
jgi:hypothetical protein